MEEKTPSQSELEAIPSTTMRKNMRNLEDIMADYIANGESELSPNEQALLDRQVHEKTGKHIGKFVNPKKPLPKNVDIVISANGGDKGQRMPNRKTTRIKKEPKHLSTPSVAGQMS